MFGCPNYRHGRCHSIFPYASVCVSAKATYRLNRNGHIVTLANCLCLPDRNRLANVCQSVKLSRYPTLSMQSIEIVTHRWDFTMEYFNKMCDVMTQILG